jgi:hypothetical protein
MMKKNQHTDKERQIDLMLDNLEPIVMMNAPEGFKDRVMLAIEMQNNPDEKSRKADIRFWRNMAAGLSLLLGLNFFTLFSTHQQDFNDISHTGEIILEYQAIETGVFSDFYQSSTD